MSLSGAQSAKTLSINVRRVVSQALPVPDLLAPFLQWVQVAVDARLNGLLLNWYQADKGHYIGPHHDNKRDLVVGSPIITISVGGTRVFRLRHAGEKGFADFPATHGTVFLLWTRLGRARFATNVPQRVSRSL